MTASFEPSMASRCACRPVRSSACSDPTVRVRRPWSASFRPSSSPTSGTRHGRGIDVVKQPGQVRKVHRTRGTVRRGRREPHRLREPSHGELPQSHGEVSVPSNVRANYWSTSASTPSPTSRPRRTPVACDVAWTWRRRSWPVPRSSSWTNRRPGSTPRVAKTSGRSSNASWRVARRSCSRRSTSKRPTDCANSSSSSTTERSSPKARRPS